MELAARSAAMSSNTTTSAQLPWGSEHLRLAETPETCLAEQSVRSRPSLLHYAPLLVITLIFVGNLWQKTDPDLWGHIRFGQLMLSRGRIVSHDDYSYPAFDHSWRDHEYLTEVIMAAIYDVSGIVGLKVWKLACVAATVLFLVQALAQTGASSLVQLAALGFAICASAQFTQFRPQLHTYMLFSVTLALLARDSYRGSAPLWLMIPVMSLWSNFHGGFVIGLIILTIYAAGLGMVALFDGSDLGHARKVGVIGVAAAGATLLPPHGVISWRAVLNTVFNPMTFRIFTEWEPLSTAMREQWRFNHYGTIAYLFLLALWGGLILSLILRPDGVDLPLVLVTIVVSVAASISVRNLPFAAMCCAVPVSYHLGLLLDAPVRGRRTHATVRYWAQYILAFAALMLTNRELVSSQLPADMRYPSAAISFIKKARLRGNFLVYFCWGEYLIWHLAPDSKVFFDSRYDMVYPLRVTNDYLTFYWGLPGADRVLKDYRHDFVLFPATGKVYDRMLRMPGWRLVYRDADAVLFGRTYSHAPKLPEKPVIGNVPTVQYFP